MATRDHGETTPQSDYRIPIVVAIGNLGGSAKRESVLVELEHLMKDVLLPADYAPVEQATHSGEAKWQNRASFERNRMKNDGLLKDNSPHSYWQLAPAGEELYRESAAAYRSASTPDPVRPAVVTLSDEEIKRRVAARRARRADGY
jgi:hypothetical protein